MEILLKMILERKIDEWRSAGHELHARRQPALALGDSTLRDALPVRASLTATDLNAPMLDIAATKFRFGEAVEFRAVDATAQPFADASFARRTRLASRDARVYGGSPCTRCMLTMLPLDTTLPAIGD